jgi:putative glutamine amidotransferase
VKPVIGITCRFIDDEVRVPYSYVKSVERAGGVPVVLPIIGCEELAANLVDGIDGLLLSGGVDLDPSHFGEDPHPKLGKVSPERDQLELAVTRTALDRDLPILAICRGIQTLNVTAGGTLMQDIQTEVESPLKHTQEAPRWHASHRVIVEPESLLMELLGEAVDAQEELWVNTFHHQAVRDTASGFAVTARAPDGVIEAVESTSHDFILGVQWHPEGMWEYHPHFLSLFEGLVQAAGGSGDE